MRLRLTSADLQRLMPADPATAAHCRRVAALAREIAGRLSMSWRSVETLEQSAMLHHTAPILFNHGSVARLLRDVMPPQDGALRRNGGDLSIPEVQAAVLDEFHGQGRRRGEAERGTRRMAEILELSNLLDEQCESLDWDCRPITEIWVQLEGLRGIIDPEVLAAAREALDAPFRLGKPGAWALPVDTTAAGDVIRGLRENPGLDVGPLTRLASRDAVMAARVVSLANSAWYGRRSPARTVGQAIAYIGAEAASKVLLALAVKPLFASAKLSELWRHSVSMAAFCESLARAAEFLNADTALLLGLVHDVGRVAIQTRPAGAMAAYTRLAERTCPTVLVEQMLFGEDHGEIGAGILESWNFPADLVEAVRHHHHPAISSSPGSAGLYVAEFWSESEEDLPSARQLGAALSRIGCSMETLAQVQRSARNLSDLLRAA
jgi:putative nucleotidyltransferase with HDIG domain